ncbi:MAG: asparaginase [Coprococcus sp.]
MSEILVKEYRGDLVENVHRGSIAIVASTGETIAYIGDIEKQTFMRSASKPVQVIPTLLAGLHEKYGLSKEEVAMFNSSHWGSTHHIFTLKDIADKTGINPEEMIMNPSRSISGSFLAEKLSEGNKLHPEDGKSKLQHCCSGKHFSLMLLQRELTGKVAGYQDPSSPVQKQILSFISMLSQTPTYKINLGIDGCGVPVFALPMRNIALAYAKLADPFNLPEDLTKAIKYNFECINEYPEKINDYYTPSYYVNKNPDLLMKDGSRGVICMAIRSRKLGIVVKMEDGWSDEFQGIIIASILEQLKYDDAELIEKLKGVYKTKLYNDCLDEVGHSEVCFDLNIDSGYFEDLYDVSDEEETSDEEEESSATDEEASDNSDINIETDKSSLTFTPVKTPSFIRNAKNKNYNDSEDEEDDIDRIIRQEEQKHSEKDDKETRNRRSILGQTVVLPSNGQNSVIMNPMVDTAGPVKSAKIISTVETDEEQDNI